MRLVSIWFCWQLLPVTCIHSFGVWGPHPRNKQHRLCVSVLGLNKPNDQSITGQDLLDNRYRLISEVKET